ncbi:ABC transporter ATP-binding protein [Myxococcaceae bacterium JPH2]|nr:ABC transporter ATP-binding protein [Myxococcaceae bacterium JPH2]
MPLLSLESVSLRHPVSGVPAVEGVSLTMEPGQVFALLGSSGSGKTTLLRLLAGLARPDAGSILLDGRVMAGPGAFMPPEERSVGAAWGDVPATPQVPVQAHLMASLGARPPEDSLVRIRALLELFNLSGLESRPLGTLSRGQVRRVSLLQSLLPGHRLLVWDEPFADMDFMLRAQVRGELRRVLASRGSSLFFATHEQADALSFADRLAVLRSGTVAQTGTPEDVYARPRTAFVAYFLGGTNLLPGTGFGNGARTALGNLPLDREARGNVLLSLRPEALRLVPDTDKVAVGGALRAEVLSRAFQGGSVEFTVACSGQALLVRGAADLALREGSRARLEVAGRAVVLEDSPE